MRPTRSPYVIKQGGEISPSPFQDLTDTKFCTLPADPGRLLLNYMLVREGFWPVNIRHAEDRVRYYDALASYNETDNADELTCLIAQRAAEQLEYCNEIARQQEAAQAMRQQR